MRSTCLFLNWLRGNLYFHNCINPMTRGKGYAECTSGMWVTQVSTLRDVERRLRVKLRESEGELDILKRRLKIQGSRDLPPSRTRPRETSSVGPSTRTGGGIPNGLRRPSPMFTRSNTQTATRGRTPSGSRPSSCPSFRNLRNQSREGVVSLIRGRSPGKQGSIRAVSSRPSLSRPDDPYAREISRSAGRTRPVVTKLSRHEVEILSTSNRTRTASPAETTSKSGRSKASRESQRNAQENVSPSPAWNKDIRIQSLRGALSNKETGSTATPLCFTTDDERSEPVAEHQVGSRLGSRASSPGTLLRDVKAKLHKYAKMEGYNISDTESRGMSGSLKDFNGDSSPIDKSAGRFDVMIERDFDEEQEVTDIDSRLHALKKFLRIAKARTVKK